MEGRAKGLAAPEATWLVGQGLQGLDQGALPPSSLRGGPRCASQGRWE